MRTSTQLAQSPLWRISPDTLNFDQRIALTYARVKSIVKTYRLTRHDLATVSPRYWEFHSDPIMMMDCSAGTLVTIHYNLCGGTLSMYAGDREDVAQILEKLLSFELSGQYCLTELGHGIDVRNMETTATLLPSGEFDLHTPTPAAAKYMPPTAPCGTPVVSVVFARLIVNDEDHGIKPFIVYLSDGVRMNPGISCKILPPRGGSRPIKHALTYFNHVRLPAAALLGNLDKPTDVRAAFFTTIYRIVVGALSMGALCLSVMRMSSYIGGKYSLRRTVIDPVTGLPRPIIAFSTQSQPVLTALSQTFVMEKMAKHCHGLFTAKTELYEKHFIAAVFKTTISRFAQSIPLILSERCGVQGLYEANQLSVLHSDIRGAVIAEGDVLAISIRFAIEVLLGTRTPPKHDDANSLLSRHEISLIKNLQDNLLSTVSSSRDPKIAGRLLPACQPLLEAIGHRMAYEIAVKEGIDKDILELFLASVIKLDQAWYSENAGITRDQQNKMEADAAERLLPRLEDFIEALDTKEYITAPIVSDESWNQFVDSLETLDHFSHGRSAQVSDFSRVSAHL
ncbi:Peroxisomal acyl-coenzyme A oxidase 3 [Psilocybe cubensis]|uniref:Peroxisomal acyl-coenzyme A oxidase 3 n=2 Tax=Psilocybe cubensis TaxID=181762 RepID=A0ACB8GQ29_PSICU|nr:Peroxisomal acyl-coenzyme A oxidase 3 [Psilocybe cubensis]KAH9477756.1 Peroxisomal acyl-coenzyme A oxidase 3 [Psilocybe cubensis]